MQRKRILLVDDLSEMLMITSKVLEISGEDFDVRTAKNGDEALKIIQIWLPDLVITDWDMPVLDGIGLTKKLREDEACRDIPVIMITGLMVTPQDLKLAFESGVSDFIKKPYDKTELVARTKSMLLLASALKNTKQLNQVLMEHNRFVSSLYSAVPSPLVYYNTEGIIISCNESFQNTFGFNSDEVIGNDVYRICPNPQQMKAQSENMIQNDIRQISFETTLKTQSDEDTSFLVTKTIYYNPQQLAEGIICLFSDISDLKKVHQQNLEEKKRELVSSAMRLMQMSEMNDKLLDDLEKIELHTDDEGKQVVKELKKKYNLKSSNSVWKEFELRFEQVYEDFYERLLKIHPDITPSEKKLCALLKLNLSSKEIAALTFQDAKSIDMARYRLRKKLNLAQEENLIDYLLKI